MEISRTKLLQALAAVQPGLASKELIQQSSSFIFKDGKVITFNDEIAVMCPIDIELEGAVQSEEIFKLLKRLTAETIDIEIVENEIKVSSGRSRSGIRLEQQINLPLEAIGAPEKWRKLPETFCAGLKFCLFSVSSDMSKPVFTCLHLSNACIESCDNFRITRYRFENKVFPQERLLPGKAASELLEYAPTHFSMTDGWLHFKNDSTGVVFSCRSYTDTFPDMSPLLELEGEKVTIPEAAQEALSRAEIFSKAEFTQDEKVDIELMPKKMLVKAQGSSGWFEESIPLKYSGEKIEFIVHPGFFKDVLGILNEITVCAGKIKLEGEHFDHVVITYPK